MAETPVDDPDDDAPVDVYDTDSSPKRSDPFDRAADPWSPHVLAQRVRMWVAWIGPSRLLGAAGVVLIIVGVGWWLLRSPALPTEAALPSVSHSTAPTAGRSAVGTAPSSTTPSGSTASEPSPVVVVHVTGAVNRPGVYELATGQRVDDALAAAGGPTPDADANSLNLAAPVLDGDRIEVPVVGASTGVADSPVAGHTHATEAADGSAAAPVDVNQADAATLDQLPGVGPSTAAAIVEHRAQNGPFASVEQLLDVAGIGPAKLDAIRDLVTT